MRAACRWLHLHTLVFETRKLSTSTARSLSASPAPPFNASKPRPGFNAAVFEHAASAVAVGFVEGAIRSSETLRSLVTSSESLERAAEIIPNLAYALHEGRQGAVDVGVSAKRKQQNQVGRNSEMFTHRVSAKSAVQHRFCALRIDFLSIHLT